MEGSAFPLRVHSWALTLRGLSPQVLGAEVQNPTPTDCVSPETSLLGLEMVPCVCPEHLFLQKH